MSKSTPSGFVIINKPSGITSFRVLGPIKKTFGTERVGHAGTLDQNASGLIIAGVGKSTRLLSQIEVMDKVYEFKVHLGCSTDTLEWTGQEVAVDADGARTVEEIEKILPRFLGAIAQIPPQYSAIKIKGKRASDIVHRGGEVKLKARQIMVHSLELLTKAKPSEALKEFTFRCHCSKGTYVRALARDMGEALGTVACASKIKRTAIGHINLKMASESIENLVLEEPESLFDWPQIELNPAEIRFIKNGRGIRNSSQEEAENVFVMFQGLSQAVASLKSGRLEPKFLLRDL